MFRRIMQRGILRFRICNHLWSVNGTLRDVFSQSVFASKTVQTARADERLPAVFSSTSNQTRKIADEHIMMRVRLVVGQ